MVSSDSREVGLRDRAMNIFSSRPYSTHFVERLGEIGLQGASFLDVGCGVQMQDLRNLARLGAGRCIGVDIRQVTGETDFDESLEFLHVDIDEEGLPFVDCSFDMVFIHDVIEHLHFPLRALEEIRRVIRPDGCVSVLTPNQAALKNRVKLALGGSIYFPLKKWVGEDDYVDKQGHRVFTGHIREYTMAELIDMVEMAGFEVVSTTFYPAAFKSGRDNKENKYCKADSITRLSESRVLFSLYHLAEVLVPSWGYMISLVGAKRVHGLGNDVVRSLDK